MGLEWGRQVDDLLLWLLQNSWKTVRLLGLQSSYPVVALYAYSPGRPPMKSVALYAAELQRVFKTFGSVAMCVAELNKVLQTVLSLE